MSEFHTTVVAPAEFPLEMLKEIALSSNPYEAAAKYKFDYDTIKDLSHFKAQMERIDNALMMEGEFTTIIAGVALQTAVQKLANRVQDDRISTGDLVKSIEVFKKVKDGLKEPEVGIAGQGVSLVINIPAVGAQPAKTIEVTNHNVIDVTEDSEELESGTTESFKINA